LSPATFLAQELTPVTVLRAQFGLQATHLLLLHFAQLASKVEQSLHVILLGKLVAGDLTKEEAGLLHLVHPLIGSHAAQFISSAQAPHSVTFLPLKTLP
jgi:hypothetical protein